MAPLVPAVVHCWLTEMAWCTREEQAHPFFHPGLSPTGSFPLTVSLCSVCLPLQKNCLSFPWSPHPNTRQIHGARFLSLFCKSCKGNLEGLSGINLKGKRLSLLLFLALSADWVCLPGTCSLLISTTPLTTSTATKFLMELSLKKKKFDPLSKNWQPHPPCSCTCGKTMWTFCTWLCKTRLLFLKYVTSLSPKVKEQPEGREGSGRLL